MRNAGRRSDLSAPPARESFGRERGVRGRMRPGRPDCEAHGSGATRPPEPVSGLRAPMTARRSLPVVALRRGHWKTATAGAALAGAGTLLVVAPWANDVIRPATVGTGRGPLRVQDSGSCHQTYSLDTLAERGFALDGTVIRIRSWAGTHVTFKVNEWFRGAANVRDVTFDVPAPLNPGQQPTDGRQLETPTYTVGTRLLLSGDPRRGGAPLNDPVVFVGCGFTRYYDAGTARAWRRTLKQ